MHDARGKALKVGDLVLIPGVVTQLLEGKEDYCNVSVKSQIGRRPDGMKETFYEINTGVLIKVSADDE